MENTEQKALAELKRVYYLINNGDLNQEGFTLYHTIGRILEDFEKAKSRELSESVRPVVVLPSKDQGGCIALDLVPDLDENEQAFFVAGFQTCIRWLNNNPDMTFSELNHEK
jgi:hypothetical protein